MLLVVARCAATALRTGFDDYKPGLIRTLEESGSRIIALQERAGELAGLADGWIHETAAELSRSGIDLQRQLVTAGRGHGDTAVRGNDHGLDEVTLQVTAAQGQRPALRDRWAAVLRRDI